MAHNVEAMAKVSEELTRCPKPGTYWRHVATGGVYVIQGGCVIESGPTAAVIYFPEFKLWSMVDHTAQIWVRPLAEFLDGRFVQIPPDAIIAM